MSAAKQQRSHWCQQHTNRSEGHARVDKPLLKSLAMDDRGRAVIPEVKPTRSGSAVAAGCRAVAVAMRKPRGLLLHVIVVRALWRVEVGVTLGRVPRTNRLEVDEPWRVPDGRMHACQHVQPQVLGSGIHAYVNTCTCECHHCKKIKMRQCCIRARTWICQQKTHARARKLCTNERQVGE